MIIWLGNFSERRLQMSASKKKKVKKENINKNNNIESSKVEITTESISEKIQEENKEDTAKEIKETETKENPEEITKDNVLEEKEESKENSTEEIKESASEVIKKENKEDAVEEIQNENKEGTAETKKEIIKIEEKPDYVKQMLLKKKRKTIIFICIVVIIVVMLIFSTVFALFNINNSNLTKGLKINNIDVSGLSVDDAKSKINEVVKAELLNEVVLKYGEDYEITLNPEQIEFYYKVDDAVAEAYSIGRSNNILQNNYTLLFTTLFGKDIKLEYSYNEEFLNSFVDDVNSKIPGLVVNPTYYIEDENLIINKGTDGIEVNKEELKDKIINAILEISYEDVLENKVNLNIDIPVVDVTAEEIDIDKIYSEVYREPQDAYFETDPYKIYADEDGIDFSISIDEAKNIISSEDKEEYTIPLKITKAEKTIDDLGTEAFPYLVSSFSTKYDASNVDRSTNLAIAANKINGKVLMPGEVFSFNKVVGKRTVEEGYKDAKIYADGGVVDGLAGGICQISSTLYNSVLLANLEIVERRNHSYTTSYVSAGRDATVVYGAIDFQFKNSRSYPIKITASVKNGIAEFQIHGMQEEQEYEIKILPVTTSSIPYTTTYVEDATLAPGQQVVSQVGHAGCKVTTYIEKRLNGQLVSKEVLSNDTYSPMKNIIRIGPSTEAQ
jgi:vancomycin resistance protein YoaR